MERENHEANAPPLKDTNHRTITEHKIGKKIYIVEASCSDAAGDTIDRKIEKLILRDCGRMLNNPVFCNDT